MNKEQALAPLNAQYRRIMLLVLPLLIALGILAYHFIVARGAGGELKVEIVAGYNLVVDSNVQSPSTAGPSVATVMGRFCNVGDAPLNNVYGYIGNYAAGTPGVYPLRDSDTDPVFQGESPLLANSGDYYFTHIGGTADAKRYMGTLPAGECAVQYWHFTYPRCEAMQNPPCSGDAVWGAPTNPNDDLWLNFDVWATASGATTKSATWKMYHRNEISAMANKIEPNPAGAWFNTTSPVLPGDIIVSNGVNYELGNINKGFDNDGDGLYDYNAWMQPIGLPTFDPACFRLVKTEGTLTIARSSGNPNLVVPFTDQLFFTNLPVDNTGVTGEVHYSFLALGGNCSISLSPYQEVASGADNEKFNADYGKALPPMDTQPPAVTISKTGDATIAKGDTLTYEIPFANTSSTKTAGPLMVSGTPVNMPLVISDSVPVGLEYVANSATVTDFGYTPNPLPGFSVRFSTDQGVTWTGEPGVNVLSSTANPVWIQWWLTEPLPTAPTGHATATFQAFVPNSYSGDIVIINEACGSFDEAASFACDDTTTLVEGDNSIGDFVWADADRDGLQDPGEAGIDGVTVKLYWDKNGNGALDSGDVLVLTQDTAFVDADTNYLFTDLPDARFLVVVDSASAALPDGYIPTTASYYAINATVGGPNYLTADFGFGPIFSIDKRLTSPNPAYGGGLPAGGETVTFEIDLINNAPGDGSAASFCTYTLWASALHSGAGSGQQAWNDPANLYTPPGPDNVYATAPLNGSTEVVAVKGFSLGAQAGTITNVEILIPLKPVGTVAGTLTVHVLQGASTELTGHIYDLASLTSGVLTIPVFGDRTWNYSDFNGDLIGVRLYARKSANPPGDLDADAVGLRVTTNQSCGGADTTITQLPMTDAYDADLLQFVSANPPASSVDTSQPEPYDGLITWNNLGPLYAGGTKTVTVTFKALQPTTPPQTTTNTAYVTDAKFGNGRDVNDDDDAADVTLKTGNTLDGTVFANNNAPGTWNPPTGYDASDTKIPGVTVELRACVWPSTGRPLDPVTDVIATNRDCAYYGGAWQTVATRVTDSSGYYRFEGLPDGYYNVVVQTGTLPTGLATCNVETTNQGNGAGGATCDSQWASQAANLNTTNFNPLTGGETVNHVSFGYTGTQGVVNGYVWNDRDGDGVWDAGEEPIPGVTVSIPGCTPATQTTDANGYYEASCATTGSYTITITPPNGMNQSGDPDVPGANCGGSCNNAATRTVTVGAVAGPFNFGYNGGFTIGDTIYVDWNGNSTQDAGEEGLPNVIVSLYRDLNGDGVLDASDPLLATDTTDANGNYLFENLAGNGNKYLVVVNSSTIPAGYVQTQNPGSSVTLTNANNLGMDYGYQPRGSSSIGDQVWYDSDADGVFDPGESGVGAGVPVLLYEDSNGDGIIDAGDALVSSTLTDADGKYLFSNLTAGNYIVHVPTPPAGYAQTNGSNNSVAVALGTNQAYRDADLGYATTVIGDLVWRDNNGNGTYDFGEPGISGVTVYLCAGSVTPCNPGATGYLAQVDTDANGNYQFDGYAPGTYTVGLDPADLTGLVQTYDPDESPSSVPCNPLTCNPQSTFNLSKGQTNRLQDFGFKPLYTIGNQLWIETVADGIYTPDEPALQNITVWLCAASDPTCAAPLATTSTNADGQYFFTNDCLGGCFVKVDVTDPDFPAGLSPAVDPDSVLDNQSVVVFGPDFTDMTKDFGYAFAPGVLSISGVAFYDINDNGLRDPAETGRIQGVSIYLWRLVNGEYIPFGSTVTGPDGAYAFNDLGPGTYAVSEKPDSPPVVALGYVPTKTGAPTTRYMGVVLSLNDVTDLDFGFRDPLTPTAVALTDFYATPGIRQVRLAWETAFDVQAVSFNIYRSTSLDGARQRINPILIAGVGGTMYEFTDLSAQPGVTYYYWLELVEGQESHTYGPLQAAAQFGLYLPIILR